MERAAHDPLNRAPMLIHATRPTFATLPGRPSRSGRRVARGLIWAARHPRPVASARICLGRTDAAPAEPPEAAAEALLDRLGLPPYERLAHVVASPLRRAGDVAAALARLTGARLRRDDRLTEQDFGDWEGQAWASLPRAELAAWTADPLGVRPGGGESLADVLDRVRRAWTTLASSADATVVVTHEAPIRCLLAVARGMPMREALRADLPFGALVDLSG